MQYPNEPQAGVPYAQPMSVLPYAVPVLNRKPVPITVIGIIGIVFGSLGILGGGLSALGMFVLRGFTRSFASGMNSPGSAAQFEAIWTWGIISSIVTLLVCIGLLVAAIAFLRLASWGLRAMVIYAIIDLGWQVTKVIVTTVWLIPTQTKQFTGGGPVPPTTAFSHVGTFLWIAVLCAFPIVVLVFANRPTVREPFASGSRQAA